MFTNARETTHIDIVDSGETPVFLSAPSDKVVTVGSDVVLKAVLKGQPEPAVLWFHGDRLVQMRFVILLLMCVHAF